MNEYKKIIVDIITSQINRILSLIDRNRDSPTYGCFDREFWHYKSKNFLNGMQQCYILSLSLLFSTNFKGNFLYKNPNLMQLIIGSLNFTLRNMHKDGSFDEHYYNEHSIAATSFLLYSITESFLLLNIKSSHLIRDLEKMTKFLNKNRERYIRANHISCIILAFYNMYLLTKKIKYKNYSEIFLKDLYKYWSKEGWFKEYNGCDPGYLTLTLSFLTKYAIKSKNEKLIKDIKKSILFCSHFMHPDGSFGGFYGSRENNHFFTFSFEKIKISNEIGKKIVNSHLNALKNGKSEIISDEHFTFLLINDLLELFKIFENNRPNELFSLNNKTIYFEEAGLFIHKDDKYHVIISLKKGGIIYIFKEGSLIFRNCGIIGKIKDKLIISTGFKNIKYNLINNNHLTIEGSFKQYKQFTNFAHIIFIFFNLLNIILGNFRIWDNYLKNKLIKILILNEKLVKINFKIDFKISKRIELEFSIMKNNSKLKIKWLKISTYCPTIYVPSNAFFLYHDCLLNDIIFDKNKVSKFNKLGKMKIKLIF
ncbi:MAG: hypothetical protein ACP6IY_02530 [Promethearchaeia archaeon]